MQRIRSRDTTPELAVRSHLHRAGLRFRVHHKDLPGTPDLVFPRYRTVIFVHGCFWHQHPGCYHSGHPASNRDYWKPKLERVVARDARHRHELEALGWRVIVMWECEITDEALQALADEVRASNGAE